MIPHLSAEQCIRSLNYDNFNLTDSPRTWKGVDGIVARRAASDSPLGNMIKISGFIALHTIARKTSIESGYKRYTKSVEMYQTFMQSIPHLEKPLFNFVEDKDIHCAVTHVHYFALHNFQLWVKPRYDDTSDWMPMYFDGWLEGRKPIGLQADGCNLIVWDDLGYIHYKKVVREVHQGDSLLFIDKAIKDNWKPNWYSLPVVSGIFNLFTPKRLFISDDIISFSISNIGRYADHYEDGAGVKHEVTTTTTLYALFRGSPDIHFGDPWWSGGFNNPPTWIGLGFDHTIPGPEDESFEKQEIDSAGSTLILSGISRGNPCYYTTLADVDSMGRNIIYRYTDVPERAIPNKVRFITPPAWIKQPDIPQNYRVTKKATIYQCGKGNGNRLLQISVLDENDRAGYLRKKIYDPVWQLDFAHSNPHK